MKWGQTTFVWDTTDRTSGPREDYAPGTKRVIAPITVLDGTPAGRVQAAKDLIGYATLSTDKVGTNLATYLKRSNPFPYPGSDNLYCYSLINGSGLGVASHGADGVSYSRGYQFDAVFNSRTYLVKEDRDVKAQASAGFVQSPLYDPTGVKLYPDEGDALKRGWLNSRYVTRRVLGAGRLITIPEGFLELETVPVQPILQTFPYNEFTASVSMTWHSVPLAAVPFDAITLCSNAINSDTLDAFPPNTLLFSNYEMDVQPGPLGTLLADVRYNFVYTPRVNPAGTPLGHEGVLRVLGVAPNRTVGYDRVRVTDNPNLGPFRGGTRPDATKIDFSVLFRPAQPTG